MTTINTVSASRGPTVPAPAFAAPPKPRRRPAIIAAAALAVCAGALIGAWAYVALGSAQEVLAVRTTVYRGQTIPADALMRVSISVDPALHPIPAGEEPGVVGKVAAFDLPAGGLVTRDAVTDTVTPARGMSVVGISLTPAMMPAETLQVGDSVRIVTTPGAQGEPPTGDPDTITATVSGVQPHTDAGVTIVDVTVPAASAPALAARAATGKVALVLDSRERG